MNAERTFWSLVNKAGSCWEWLGHKHSQGYGLYRFHSRQDTGAHRISWFLANGPIPDGLFVCHHCDNPPCVNPSHLFLGTARDNAIDASRKGRLGNNSYKRQTHCIRGHEYSAKNTRIRPQGYRECKMCKLEHNRQYRRKRRILRGVKFDSIPT